MIFTLHPSQVTVHLGAPPGFVTLASVAWRAVAHQDRIRLRQNGGCKPPLSEIGERLPSQLIKVIPHPQVRKSLHQVARVE
jgi:hypothetical protein